MRQARKALFMGGVLIGAFLATTDGQACTCIGASDAKNMREVARYYSESAKASAVIFEGLVEKQELRPGHAGAPSSAMSLTLSGAHRVVQIRVLRVYRGQPEGIVSVVTGFSEADCGYEFEVKNKYLVYADRVDGQLFTNICTGTQELDRSGPALRFLRGEPPAPDDLLDSSLFYRKLAPKVTGKACGRVSKADGSPLGEASVKMTQIRDDSFPPKTASDEDLSKPDGTFCIMYIPPGKYLLAVEKSDYDHDIRWMGYFPGVGKSAEARPIQIKAGDDLSGLTFTARRQRLYTVSFRIEAYDGSPLALERFAVTIESLEKDPLGYHLTQHRSERGYFTVGYVPPGRYVVRTLIQPILMMSEPPPPEFAKWEMAEQKVEVRADTTITLQLKPRE